MTICEPARGSGAVLATFPGSCPRSEIARHLRARGWSLALAPARRTSSQFAQASLRRAREALRTSL
jgi:hypothetical protein